VRVAFARRVRSFSRSATSSARERRASTTAVALVVDEEYVLLSRTMDAPFLRVPALDLGDSDLGWRVGPIAF
jgi:hypothetical protein